MATAPADRHQSGVVTDLSFLDSCNALVRELYVYWDERRAGRFMPLRSDSNPAAFSCHLPGILLVDVRRDPMDFVYRVVGTREVEARGCNPTGKPVADNWIDPGKPLIQANH